MRKLFPRPQLSPQSFLQPQNPHFRLASIILTTDVVLTMGTLTANLGAVRNGVFVEIVNIANPQDLMEIITTINAKPQEKPRQPKLFLNASKATTNGKIGAVKRANTTWRIQVFVATTTNFLTIILNSDQKIRVALVEILTRQR